MLAWSYLDQPHGSSDEGFRPDYGSDDATVALSQFVARASPDHASVIRTRVVCDLPARALLEASTAADLLVVGARGFEGFRGLLLGSVSHQLAHHTNVPLAIVRHDDRKQPASEIVVGIDGSPTSLRALAWALDEGRARQARVKVVHAWRPVVLGSFGYAAPMYDFASLEAEAKDLVDHSISESRVDGLPQPVETVVVGSAAAPAILEAATRASLLVVGSRGLGGFAGLLLGSVSQHIVQHASCPVVLIPPADRVAT